MHKITTDSTLELLEQVSNILMSSSSIKDILDGVLSYISQYLDLYMGMLTIYDRKRDTIFINNSFGLSNKEIERGIYRPGEGITGKVVETGEAVVIEDVFAAPDFLGRSVHQDGGPLSFICIPIKNGTEVVGTISAYHAHDKCYHLKKDAEILKIISVMIFQSVRIFQLQYEDNFYLAEENKRLHEELHERFRPENIIGNSKSMKVVFSMIKKVSASSATVLILGESGVGKELVAHALHYNSPRSSEPFIKFNCAALPESIIESELFGHEKGAFSGAVQKRKGRFEMADKGSIFLDEIGELSLQTQAKLLRVLQEKEFEPVGGSVTISVDIRIIAATNRNLEEKVQTGSFREDLYYRLNVVPITVPPLRERKTDIPLLADYFLEKYADFNGKNITRIATPVIDMIMSYHWPGNVRELENCIERAVVLSDDEVIHAHHLPPTLQTTESTGNVFSGKLEEMLASYEYKAIVTALKSVKGNVPKAALNLGLTERKLRLRLEKYDIDSREYYLWDE